jgi:prevent-host-death family protein
VARVPASQFQREFGRLRGVAHREVVIVTSHGRDDVVLLSAEEYQRLRSLEAAAVPAQAARYDHEMVSGKDLWEMKRAGQAESRRLVASGTVAPDAIFLLRGEQVAKAAVSWPDAPLSAAAAVREKRGERSTDPATAA